MDMSSKKIENKPDSIDSTSDEKESSDYDSKDETEIVYDQEEDSWLSRLQTNLKIYNERLHSNISENHSNHINKLENYNVKTISHRYIQGGENLYNYINEIINQEHTVFLQKNDQPLYRVNLNAEDLCKTINFNNKLIIKTLEYTYVFIKDPIIINPVTLVIIHN